MSDIEKIITAFELHRAGKCVDTNKQLCPYWDCYDDCYKQMADDMFSLLKEQEQTIRELKGFINGFSKDAIAPVRCKDCSFFTVTKFDADNYGHCRKDVVWKEVTTDWHCADGVKRDD